MTPKKDCAQSVNSFHDRLYTSVEPLVKLAAKSVLVIEANSPEEEALEQESVRDPCPSKGLEFRDL